MTPQPTQQARAAPTSPASPARQHASPRRLSAPSTSRRPIPARPAATPRSRSPPTGQANAYPPPASASPDTPSQSYPPDLPTRYGPHRAVIRLTSTPLTPPSPRTRPPWPSPAPRHRHGLPDTPSQSLRSNSVPARPDTPSQHLRGPHSAPTAHLQPNPAPRTRQFRPLPPLPDMPTPPPFLPCPDRPASTARTHHFPCRHTNPCPPVPYPADNPPLPHSYAGPHLTDKPGPVLRRPIPTVHSRRP